MLRYRSRLPATALAAALLGCADPEGPVLLTGTVTDDGLPAADLPIEVGDLRLLTDGEGRFAVEVARPIPPVTAVWSATSASTVLTQGTEVTIERTSEPPRQTATIDLELTGVGAEPGVWDIRFQTLEGTPREPRIEAWIPRGDPPTQRGRPDRYRTRLEVPASTRWAMSILAYETRDGRARIRQSAVFPSDTELPPGGILDVNVLMSDETLRDPLWWDASGPRGPSVTRFVQQLAVSEFVLDLPTWIGPADGYVEVPVVQRFDADEVGFRAELVYNAAGACAERTLVVPLRQETVRVPGDVYDPDNGRLGRVPAPGVTVDAEVPNPFTLAMEGPDERPSLSLAFVPEGVDRVDVALDTPRLSWRVTGDPEAWSEPVPWPDGLDGRGADVLQGQAAWRRDGVEVRCLVDAP